MIDDCIAEQLNGLREDHGGAAAQVQADLTPVLAIPRCYFRMLGCGRVTAQGGAVKAKETLGTAVTRPRSFSIVLLGRVDEYWRDDVFGIPELNET